MMVMATTCLSTQFEQALSDEQVKRVNEAYKTLRDPNLRALYMVRVRRIVLGE